MPGNTPTQFAPRTLAVTGQFPSSNGTLYTGNSSIVTQITSILVTNTTVTATAVTVYLVPVGSVAQASHAVANAFSVPGDGLPYEILQTPKEVYLGAGSSIQGFAGTAATITFHISGVELETGTTTSTTTSTSTTTTA